MSRDEQQPHAETPIDLVAEELIRRRSNSLSGVVDTIRIIFKQSLIISSPGLAEREPDLGDMETYRQFLKGANEETLAS